VDDAPTTVDRDAPVATPDAPVDAPPGTTVMVFGERNGATNGTWFDAFLEQGSPGDNMGNHADLHLVSDDDGPILIRIDVSTIPSDATVTAARLKFRVTAAVMQDDRGLRDERVWTGELG
jgi:hypothetical protein